MKKIEISKTQYTFGDKDFDSFKKGSMVSWTPINKEKQFGIIIRTFISGIEGTERSVALAEIITLGGQSIKMILKHLELVSEVKCQIKDIEKKKK